MTVINNQMTFSSVIENARIKAGLTQEELASKANVSIRNLKLIENGETNPSLTTMLTLCETLKLDMSIDKHDMKTDKNILSYTDSNNPAEYNIMHFIMKNKKLLNDSRLPFTIIISKDGSYDESIINCIRQNDDYNLIITGNRIPIGDDNPTVFNLKLLNEHVYTNDEFISIMKTVISSDDMQYVNFNHIIKMIKTINDGNGFTYNEFELFEPYNDDMSFVKTILKKKFFDVDEQTGYGLVKDIDYSHIVNEQYTDNSTNNVVFIPFYPYSIDRRSLGEIYMNHQVFKRKVMISACYQLSRVFSYVTDYENNIISHDKPTILLMNIYSDVSMMTAFQSNLINILSACRSSNIIPILNVNNNNAGILNNSKIKARITDVIMAHDDYIQNSIQNIKLITGMKSTNMASFITRMPVDEYMHYDYINDKYEPFLLTSE